MEIKDKTTDITRIWAEGDKEMFEFRQANGLLWGKNFGRVERIYGGNLVGLILYRDKGDITNA